MTGFPTRLDEPNDADEYEEMRSKAAVPFQRPEVMPKPGTAGRLFDDEEGLENYDPLFDEMDEEEDS